jgi:hypothetical protein
VRDECFRESVGIDPAVAAPEHKSIIPIIKPIAIMVWRMHLMFIIVSFQTLNNLEEGSGQRDENPFTHKSSCIT